MMMRPGLAENESLKSTRMYSQEPIIIIDDDMDDHYIFREIAERLNLRNELIFFRNGLEVLPYLRTTTQHPFIIFCDMNMPQMDGLELRKRINEEEFLRKKSIPFVFFTTAASAQQIRQAYDLTVQGFFIKESSFIETERTFKLILDYWDKSKHPNSVR
jgi:CheY-like chemotaxis protein